MVTHTLKQSLSVNFPKIEPSDEEVVKRVKAILRNSGQETSWREWLDALKSPHNGEDEKKILGSLVLITYHTLRAALLQHATMLHAWKY